MTEYLRPKVKVGNLSRRTMEDGIFRNPPTYTALGGFTSEQKWSDPAGRRYATGLPTLERGGPTAQKGKPI
jgi:hypothetical protein